MRKLFTMLLAIIMAMTMIPFVGTQKTKADLRADGVSGRKTAEDYGLQEPRIQNGVTIWDTVFFGNYPQSRKGSNDFNNEPIKWRVLEIEDNTAYMIADKILDSYKYNLEQEVTKWGISPLRSWLGNTFYNKAFNEEERQDIYHAIVKTSYSSKWYGNGVESTWDRVLAPSYYDPHIQRFGFDTNPRREHNTRYAKVTDYSASKGVPYITDNGVKKNNGIWMTRSDNSRYLPRWVDSNGVIFDRNSVSDWHRISRQIKKSGAMIMGVRPTIHLDLSSTNWKYAGTVKSNGEVNEVSDAQNPNEVETPQGEFISVEDLDNPVMEDGVSTWDCVYYGKYPQTLGSDGKFKNEPVKWRVLSKDGNDLFLMADKALDARFFQDSKIKTTWENSETRRYINKYLLNRLFTSRELENVKLSKVNTPKNPKNGRSGGGDTEDKIYLLSYQEIENSDFGFDRKYDQTTSTRSIYTSDYAYYKRTNQRRNVANTELTYWYLRSPGVYDINIGIVHPNGYSDINGTMVYYGKDYMVPVMHLDAKTAKIKYAGTVSSDGVITNGKTQFRGKCGDKAKWFLDTETGLITISGEGNMYNYNSIEYGSDSPWNQYKDSIDKINIGEDIKSIGSNAFKDCENLTEVYLPKGISKIEENSFEGSTNKATFNVAKYSYSEGYCSRKGYNYTVREENYYGTCGLNLKWEFNPSNSQLRIYGTGDMQNYTAQTTTGNGAFSSWDRFKYYIKKVIIENGAISIGNCAFRGFSNLKEVEIPNSVTSIGVAAFQYCSSLDNVIVPNKVTELKRSVFSWCHNLKNITMPETITKINAYAFEGCDWRMDSIIIPRDVKTIDDKAFLSCTLLKNIHLPDSISSIHNGAFEKCPQDKVFSVKKNSYGQSYCIANNFNYVTR